ncbi:1-deoxy-D-xylulose-5-phosphate synthase [Candidatus Rubidus massiliensis]|nr:1-deoxy-D-xylulose-5-phosphate synthase [Candidatus Rubidus massiliensis]
MNSLLDKIESPIDLKNFSIEQLEHLALEIRQKIIEVMSKNGGHLASNLGTVELTIALHKVFHSPNDKFIWDVSHQAYTHKILTNRKELFSTIRQYKGLCGFTHPKESPHDHFHAGHAGTALSLGLGLATTRDLNAESDHVIPIIGDATLTCGLSLEALNNIPKDLKKFILILNDNKMSISKNVGAITYILSRILNNPTSSRIYRELEKLVGKIPNYGRSLSQQGRKITESIKNLVSPAAFFEQFGLSYIGPINGHNINEIIEALEGLKDCKWPTILHVLTEKGHGMEEAIKNPVCYHGAKPFNLDTGKFLPANSTQKSFPKVFGSHILKMADKNKNIITVTPAMSAGSCLDEFMIKYPKRCIDVGIAESHAVTFCGGLAKDKRIKVFCSIYATFLQRAFDNLFHDVCLQELPVVFAIDRAGISGPDGSTHHGIYDISFLNAMPNMIIAQPRNGNILKELMESSLTYDKPFAIRYPNMVTDDDDEKISYRPIGKGEILVKGKKYLLIALGHMNSIAMQVHENLQQCGIEATVFDPIFLKPLDSLALNELLIEHDTIITIEEHAVNCGLGSIINNFLALNDYRDVKVLNIGIPELFLEHGSHKALSEEIGLSSSQITKKILDFSLKTIENDNKNLSVIS